MLNKKRIKFICIFLCLFLILFKGNSVKALSTASHGVSLDRYCFGSYPTKLDDGTTIYGYCADVRWVDIPEGTEMWPYDVYDYFQWYRDIQNGVKLSKAQANEVVLKLGAFQYYYEHELDLGSTSGYEGLRRITQEAFWYILSDYYGNITKSEIDSEYIGGTGSSAHKLFMQYYNDAEKWYNKNKDLLSVKGRAWYNSSAQPTLELEVTKINYDYSLDMACENCDSKNADSKAIVIQDTTNWDAILHSEDAAKACGKNTKNVLADYYKKNGVYCREEYHVYYPNANNRIKVQVGRFFTVNASKSELDLVDGSIPNFAPIRVKKIRQCKGQETDLKKFNNISARQFLNCGGNIEITYTETGYEYTGFAKQRPIGGTKSEIKDGILTQTAEIDYTLASGVYQYVRISDGYSIKNKTKLKKGVEYKNLKVSNFPISFDVNTKPKVKLVYSLPNYGNACKDSFSTISSAYTKNNDVLNCSDVTKNVYEEETEYEKLADSACAKLYNSTNSGKYKACVKERTKNKMGDCFVSNKNGDYLCNLPTDNKINCNENTAGKKVDSDHDYTGYVWNDKENKCILKCTKYKGKYYGKNGKETTLDDFKNQCSCTKNNHEDFGRDWNEKESRCCEPGTIYNEKTGKCSGKPAIEVCTAETVDNFPGVKWVDGQCCYEEDYNSQTQKCEPCSIDNYQNLGRDWNKNEGKCCPIGYKYNDSTKKCEPSNKTNKCDDQHLNCSSNNRPCCEDSEGHAFCGYNVNGNIICPGKPDIIPAEAVYRTINPSAPFVSQNGENRTVGSNWCSYDINAHYNCSSDDKNGVVESVIINANTSEDNALYTINLDTAAINQIRNYNRGKNYDDFEMECDAAGDKCRSKFIHEEISQYVDNSKSKCMSANDFYGCANAK